MEAIAASQATIIASPENWDLPLLSPERDAAARAGTIPTKTREQIAETQLRYPDVIDDTALIPPVADPDPNSLADNPFRRSPPYDCRYPYEYLLVARQLVTPCCFIFTVPGMAPIRFDGTQPFMEMWNGPQMMRVRETLAKGPMLANCLTCPANQ